MLVLQAVFSNGSATQIFVSCQCVDWLRGFSLEGKNFLSFFQGLPTTQCKVLRGLHA
jgi:hypothetical protein